MVIYFIVDSLFAPLESKIYEASNLFVLLNSVSLGCITLPGIPRQLINICLINVASFECRDNGKKLNRDLS